MIKGLIFDVHRTLVDDTGFPRDRIWRLIAREGIEIDVKAYHQQYHIFSAEFFDWPNIHPFISIREIHRRRLARYYQVYEVKRDIENDLNFLWNEMGKCKIYPEVQPVLNQLKNNYKIGLLSNADDDDPLIDILLKTGYKFDAIITSQAYKIYKPHRKIFDIALQKMNLEPDEVLMIGDSLVSDIEGARNVGIKNVWINRNKNALKNGLPEPDFQISNLQELLPILPSAASCNWLL